MRRVPNALFVVDPKLEHNAVAEAKKLNIPVFGIIDTNADPDEVTYAIPSNDDAVKAIKLVTGLLADAVVEAKGGLTTVAYGVQPEEVVSMVDALNTFDKQEESRLIKDKKIEDAKKEISAEADVHLAAEAELLARTADFVLHAAERGMERCCMIESKEAAVDVEAFLQEERLIQSHILYLILKKYSSY